MRSGLSMEGKTGIVTGAAAGLGRAVALELVARGAGVLVFDLDGDGAETVVREIEALGGRAAPCAGDVFVEADVARAVAAWRSELGSVDFLDNNAALAVEARLHDTSLEQWQDVMRVNLQGAFLCAKHAVMAMRGCGGGSIVNTGSIVSVSGDRATC